MKKHLVKAMAHSIHRIVYIKTLFRHVHVKKVPRQPFQGGIVWTVLHRYTVRLRQWAIKWEGPQHSRVKVFWVSGRVSCLYKCCESRNICMAMWKKRGTLTESNMKCLLMSVMSQCEFMTQTFPVIKNCCKLIIKNSRNSVSPKMMITFVDDLIISW
jgi:hypothetical protein